jgi:hypothetical protein
MAGPIRAMTGSAAALIRRLARLVPLIGKKGGERAMTPETEAPAEEPAAEAIEEEAPAEEPAAEATEEAAPEEAPAEQPAAEATEEAASEGSSEPTE